jgi:RNA polymerase sigma factor (TIGR02999 family)
MRPDHPGVCSQEQAPNLRAPRRRTARRLRGRIPSIPIVPITARGAHGMNAARLTEAVERATTVIPPRINGLHSRTAAVSDSSAAPTRAVCLRRQKWRSEHPPPVSLLRYGRKSRRQDRRVGRAHAMTSDSSNAAGTPSTQSLTELLRAAHAGDRGAADNAYRVLYPELCKIARARLRVNRPDTLLDTEALVLESYLHMVGVDGAAFESRRHFYAYAAKVMRHIVIDFARRNQAARHGADFVRVTLGTDLAASEVESASVLDVERALLALEALDNELSQVVEMRYFGGYGDAEIATALAVTERTVRRYWDKARMFMLTQLEP